MWLSDIQKIGAALIFGSLVCFLLGIASFFDARLLSFGNLLFVIGLVVLCGPPRAASYFFAPRKRKAGFCFVTGVVLVLRKWAFTGFICEVFGLLNLFADFSGVIIAFLRQIPLIGTVLNHPSVSPYVERFATGHILPVWS